MQNKIQFSKNIKYYNIYHIDFRSTLKVYFPGFCRNTKISDSKGVVVWVNGVSSSKQENKKLEILWFENFRVIKNTFCKIFLIT